MKEKGDSRYKRFIETAFREVSRVLRQYSSRFSKKTYTQRQLAVAILLMKYENKTYRDIADLLTEFTGYFEFEGSTPHFTTLQKFFDRIPTYVWEFLLTKTYELFAGEVANVAIDSTGYRLHHASQHYEHRIGRKRERKRFMKHILSIDTDSQAIIVSESRRSCINDNITFRPMLKKTNVGRTAYSGRIKAILVECEDKEVAKALIEDLKEYDSGEIHDELKWIDVQERAVQILNARLCRIPLFL